MIFARMIKVDAAQHLIFARLDETPDRSKMVLDYASSKPQFETWSDSMRKASGGKNLGNVRLQHSLAIGGKVEQIAFDDNAKTIDFMIKTTDAAWPDVEAGYYTGISQGGHYGLKWNDGGFTRYTAIPEELSLVDRPCNPNATFTMVKVAGVEEQLPFKPADRVGHLIDDLMKAPRDGQHRILFGQTAMMLKAVFNSDEMRAVAEAAGLEKRDYDSDTREAMAKSGEARPDGSFPIRTATDVENAIDDFGRAGSDPADKEHIIARAKAIGATDALPEDWEGSTKKKEPMKKAGAGDMRKGIGDVAQMASLLEQLKWLAVCVTADATAERDGSPMPGRLAAWLQDGVAIFTDLAAEETKEALTALQASVDAIPAQVMTKAATPGMGGADMLKVSVAISKANMTHVQAIHDHARDLGADCGAASGDGDGKMMKAVLELGTVRQELATAQARIVELEKLPAGGGPVLRVATDDRATDEMLKAVEPPKEITDMPNGSEKSAALFRWNNEHPTAPRAPARIG